MPILTMGQNRGVGHFSMSKGGHFTLSPDTWSLVELFRAVIEILKGEKTATQLAGELGVHQNFTISLLNFNSW